MLNPQVQNWIVRKPLARGAGGVVAGQNLHAARAGARALAAGGHAIDGALTMAMALAALEPWNSGLGGIGFMVVWDATAKRAQVVDCGPIASKRLDPGDYPLSGEAGADLFGWPGVVEDRNVHGPLSIAVPALVDGWRLAHETWGRRPWAELAEPAIAFAEDGLPVDWWLTLKVANEAKPLARYESSRKIWLVDGLPPVAAGPGVYPRVKISGLAGTLRRLASDGPRGFYEGQLARALVDDLRAVGARVDAADLAGYRARLLPALELARDGATLALAPGLTAGPTFERALGQLPDSFAKPGPGADAFVAYAGALRAAYAERLERMGAETVAAHTTHHNAVDRDGNMVALTQTLLSSFGSRVVLPETGVLMNNGVYWFDPRPGRPNSMAPGKKPLTNMCPVVARRGNAGWFAVGASGGRRILPAVLQMTSFLVDHGLDLETAAHHPRIDVSDPDTVTYDPRLAPGVRDALAAKFPTHGYEHVAFPGGYASPSAVLRDGAGACGIGDAMSPWSGAVAEDDA